MPVSTSLDPEDLEALDELSLKTGLTLSELIRRAVKDLIRRELHGGEEA